jgi:hypothetical protein
MTPRDASWDDDRIDPLKGSKGDTAFLRENYKLMAVGGVFRTPKARFSPEKIHAEAEKAGFLVHIKDESPWLKVTAIERISKERPKVKKQGAAEPTPLRGGPAAYQGAGKTYPEVKE